MHRLCSVDNGDLHQRSRYRDRHVTVRRQAGVRSSYLLRSVQTGSGGTHNLLYSGYRGSFSRVSRSRCEAEHSSSSRLRMSGATSPLAISFHGVQSDNICTAVASKSTNTDVQLCQISWKSVRFLKSCRGAHARTRTRRHRTTVCFLKKGKQPLNESFIVVHQCRSDGS